MGVNGGREIYEKSLHHSDSNADYRDQYCTNMLHCTSKYFCSSEITFLNHRFIDDIFVCIVELSNCSMLGKKNLNEISSWNQNVRSLLSGSLLVAMEVGAEEDSLYIQIENISSAWCHLNIFH